MGPRLTSSSDQFTYSNASLPSVSALSVSSGPTYGGTAVTITGSNFTGATAVLFGSVETDIFSVLSDTSILVWAPEQAAGSVSVKVRAYSGTSTTYASYTYTTPRCPRSPE